MEATTEIYTKQNPRKEIIRDGIYVKYLGDNLIKRCSYDAYMVDFWGNIFWQKILGSSIKLCNVEQLDNAKKDGFHCIRNLTDNEIFVMNNFLAGK